MVSARLVIPRNSAYRTGGNMTHEPSPEVKAMLGAFVRKQREKYGDDWKRIKAEEMTAQMSPVIHGLLELGKQVKKPGGTGG